jgi:hypothetical protein
VSAWFTRSLAIESDLSLESNHLSLIYDKLRDVRLEINYISRGVERNVLHRLSRIPCYSCKVKRGSVWECRVLTTEMVRLNTQYPKTTVTSKMKVILPTQRIHVQTENKVLQLRVGPIVFQRNTWTIVASGLIKLWFDEVDTSTDTIDIFTCDSCVWTKWTTITRKYVCLCVFVYCMCTLYQNQYLANRRGLYLCYIYVWLLSIVYIRLTDICKLGCNTHLTYRYPIIRALSRFVRGWVFLAPPVHVNS